MPLPALDRANLLPEKRLRIIERDQHICQYCHQVGSATHGTDGRIWHVDHVIPRIRGGSHEDSNLALSCSTYNRRKFDKLGWTYERYPAQNRTVQLTLRLRPQDAQRLAYAAKERRISQTDVLEQLLMTLPPRSKEDATGAETLQP